MVVNLQRNINEINLKGVFLVLAHGNMAHLKRRANVRLMRQFAVRGIDTLKEEKEAINDDSAFEMVCAKYYEYSVRYCLNQQDREELHTKFKEALGIDIVELVDRLSPLGFKFKFSEKLPELEVSEDERTRKIDEAMDAAFEEESNH